jgi:two-component system nitrate/nitrite response regulator NarL
MQILIVDDHSVVRQGVAALMLQAFGPSTRIQHAVTLAAALEAAAANPGLDVVLLDLFLADEGGPRAAFAGIEAFGKVRPELPVVILSSSENPRDVRGALAAGALGYVPKSASPETLKAALDLVLKGELYVPPLMLGDSPISALAAHPAAPTVQLTARQGEVLDLIVEGRSNKEIARAMQVSDKTVKAHVTAIFKALGVSSRTQAVRLAQMLARP